MSRGLVPIFDEGEIERFNPPHFVDLGLPSRTLWWDRNLGAETPKDAGLYFQWGDIQGYTKDQVGVDKQFDKNWTGYTHYKYESFTKYCKKTGEFDFTTLQPEDDAVYQVFKNPQMHIPADWQFRELLSNLVGEEHGKWYKYEHVTWWVERDKDKKFIGYTIKSNTNNNSIFLPASGDACFGDVSDEGQCGYFWSGSLDAGGVQHACRLYFYSGGQFVGSGLRSVGFPIRPCTIGTNHK